MMLSTTKTQREYYNLDRQRACEKLGITINQYNAFRGLGNKLHRIYEDQCNGYYNPITGGWNSNIERIDEKHEKMYMRDVLVKAENLGLNVYFQTDPRGATIYLSKEPIAENSYSSTAQCIY